MEVEELGRLVDRTGYEVRLVGRELDVLDGLSVVLVDDPNLFACLDVPLSDRAVLWSEGWGSKRTQMKTETNQKNYTHGSSEEQQGSPTARTSLHVRMC